MQTCDVCGRTGFKNKIGLAVHKSKAHKPNPVVDSSKTYSPRGISSLNLGTDNEAMSSRSTGNEKTQLKRFFKVNPWARAAIDVIARSCVTSGYHMSLKKWADEDQDYTQRIFILEKFFEMINEEDHLEDLIMDVVIDIMVYGDAFWEIAKLPEYITFKDKFKRGLVKVNDIQDIPIRIYHIDAISMKVITDGKGVKGYKQVFTDGRKPTYFKKNQIIHFKYPGVGVDSYGLSPLSTVKNDMAGDLLSADHNYTFFTKGVTPRLHIDLGNVGEKELKRFTARAGKELKGKPHSSIVTIGGATVKPISVSNKDMEFEVYTKRMRERIFAVLGLQPAILGLVEDTREMEQQISLFTTLTCTPIQRLIARRINRKIINQVFMGVPIDLVFNPISNLDVSSYVKMMESDLKNLVLTVNEVRKERGLKPVWYGDDPVIPFSDASLALLGRNGRDVEESEDEDEEENQ